MEGFETEVVVALIAVFASIIGLVISKEQKTSEFRQAWINTLRDNISEFLTEADRTSKLVLINKTSEGLKKIETSDAVILGSVALIGLKSKIKLLINSNEKSHADLANLLDKTIENIRQQKDNFDNIENLTATSQNILKEEWKRVKTGEPIYRALLYVLGIVISGLIVYSVYKILCG